MKAQGLDFTFTDRADDPDRPTVDGVNHLRRKFQASQRLNHALNVEKVRNENLLKELRAASESARPGAAAKTALWLGFLQRQRDLTRMDPKAPLTTATAFSVSQLSTLQSLSTSLSSILNNYTIENAGKHEPYEHRNSWRQERLQYVERNVRGHLEILGGHKLAVEGRLNSEEGQSFGRVHDRAELEALEKVAATVAASTRDM